MFQPLLLLCVVFVSVECRKIIRVFPYNGEKNMLLYHKKEGDSNVLIVVAESMYSFHGKSKNSSFKGDANNANFTNYRYENVTQNLYQKKDKWAQEVGMRNLLGQHASKMYNEQVIKDDDIFVLTDADEIINAKSLQWLRENAKNGVVYQAELKWHLYSPCFIHRNPWTANVAVTIYTLRTQFQWRANLVRSSNPNVVVIPGRAGIHCSWCFFTPSQFRKKMRDSHDGENVGLYKTNAQRWTDKRIMRFMKYGLWLDGVPHGRNAC